MPDLRELTDDEKSIMLLYVSTMEASNDDCYILIEEFTHTQHLFACTLLTLNPITMTVQDKNLYKKFLAKKLTFWNKVQHQARIKLTPLDLIDLNKIRYTLEKIDGLECRGYITNDPSDDENYVVADTM